MRRFSFVFALHLCLLLLLARAATAQRYTITDLGTLGGSQSIGLDISQGGQVTGNSSIACLHCSLSHAFLYHNGYMQDLGTLPGGSFSAGYGVSGGARHERGERQEILVTGSSNLEACSFNNCSPVHAFLYENGNMSDLGTLPGGSNSEGYAVNRTRQVTGWADDGNNQHAFLYSNGIMQDLGTLPGGIASFGVGINDGDQKGKEKNEGEYREHENRAQVTGYSSTAGGSEHAFLYSNGTMRDLGTLPGGRFSAGYAINQAGQVTGYSEVPGGNARAFLYSNGTMRDLGTLPGTDDSFGEGINRSGMVVGFSTTFPDSRAFLYSNGTMQDLNGLIPSNSGWVLEFANAINDRGQITGSGTYAGETHAFLLTPVCAQNKEHDRDGDGCDTQERQ